MVSEEDRLGALEVGVAGHDQIQMGFGLTDQGPLKAGHEPADEPDLFPQVEAQIEYHLVVSAPAGVQLRPRLSHLLDQAALDRHVNIFR